MIYYYAVFSLAIVYGLMYNKKYMHYTSLQGRTNAILTLKSLDSLINSLHAFFLGHTRISRTENETARQFTALAAGLITLYISAALIDPARLAFRRMEHLAAQSIASLAHLAVAVTLAAIRTAAAD